MSTLGATVARAAILEILFIAIRWLDVNLHVEASKKVGLGQERGENDEYDKGPHPCHAVL